jgi:hypothetical protein
VTHSLAQANTRFAAIRSELAEFLVVRADLAELRADLAEHGVSPFGALADAKALEARLHNALSHFDALGWQVKGFAPILLDLPGERDGAPVLWCWLEGDAEIAWYHRLDTGFAGRRPA